MRCPTLLALLVPFSLAISPAFAIPAAQGKYLAGAYKASGKASVAGVTVRYSADKVRVNPFGRVIGRLTKRVYSSGNLIEVRSVRIKGAARSIKIRRTTFEAPARLRVSDGAVITGKFAGLTDRQAKLSRFFRGKISDEKGSNFVLRAR